MAGCGGKKMAYGGKVKKKMQEGGRVKKTNELTGEAKEKARKTFAGEKKGLAGRLDRFLKGVKERRAEADKKMSDRAKAKRDQAKGITAVPGTMKGEQVDTTKGPNMNRGTKPKKETGSMPAPRPRPESKVMYEEEALKIGPNMSKVNKPEKEKFDRMAAARNQQRMAQKSMGFKKGGSVKRNMRDGCAVRGKTKGKMC